VKTSTLVAALIISLSSVTFAETKAPSDHVYTEMRNVLYHFTPSIAVHIVHLEGELAPSRESGIPVFDDADSFTILIRSAEISVTTEALSAVLNQYVFSSADAPLQSIRVSALGDKLKIKGRMHRHGDLSFESTGSVAPTAQGDIRVHLEQIKAAHVPVKGLMDLLGETVSNLLGNRKVAGVRAEENDLILTPAELFPPPHIKGQLTTITVRGNEIVQQYGSRPSARLKISGNYMAYRGARLRFGKLTMSDTDLTILDLNPEDPFDFFLDHYRDQLVAGYTKTTPSFGLRSYFRDYEKLGAKKPSPD
jgi:hypothetical protein